MNRRRPWWVLALALCALLVVALIRHGDDSGRASPSPQPVSTAQEEPSTDPSRYYETPCSGTECLLGMSPVEVALLIIL